MRPWTKIFSRFTASKQSYMLWSDFIIKISNFIIKNAIHKPICIKYVNKMSNISTLSMNGFCDLLF